MSSDETIFRYLPKEGDSQTHVATLSGHAAQVYPIDPVDGKKGTLLHPRFHQAAVAADCRAFMVEEEVEPTKPSRSAKPLSKAPATSEAMAA